MTTDHPSPLTAESPPRVSGWRGELVALAACIAIAALLGPFHAVLDTANTAMIFLLGVALVAYRFGRRPAIVAALASVALLDFFFVQPRFSFAVHDAQHLVMFAVMLAVGLIITHLTQHLQLRGDEALARESQAQALYGLARTLAGAIDRRQVDAAVRDFLAASIGARARLVLGGKGEALVDLADERCPPTLDTALIRATLADAHPHRCTSATADNGLRLLLPMAGAAVVRGVLVVDVDAAGVDALRRQQAMLEAVAALAATAIERLHFVDVAQSAQLETASERLRSSILSALSHDVRTPLTALYGLADSLALSPSTSDAHETARAIRDQALRLNGMVGKLLDMARLQAGEVRLRREWQPLEEVVGSSLKLLGTALDAHRIEIDLPEGLPLLEFDAVLIERVLGNLLENAARTTPPGGAIRIAASRIETASGPAVEIAVADNGPGIAADSLERIFGLFERGTRVPPAAGSGLGLSICHAIVAAHGGRIHANNIAGGGARVAFTLPCGTPPAVEAENQ